jgi:hypothetical protein
MPAPTRLLLNVNFENNLFRSVWAFLATNIVTPYNVAVTGTNFSQAMTMLIKDPDDSSLVASVPAIVMDLPFESKSFDSTGSGDGLVWQYWSFPMEMYPGIFKDPGDGAGKPSVISASYMRSLCVGISTALLVPLYDYTVSSVNPVDVAFITGSKLTKVKGAAADMLAMDKHRFNYELSVRFATATLNG